MIHVITVHWKNPFWIEPQLRRLERHIDSPFRVYTFINGFDAQPYRDRFYFIGRDPIVMHAAKLNRLANIACLGSESDDDWLIFIDSDAFPIADLVPALQAQLARHPLVAVRRDENNGDSQPHPCFCATTVGFWRRIRGDWQAGHEWLDASGKPVTDVGGNLLRALQQESVDWLPLLRTNRTNLHPVFFGVYGDLVYHHGAGSRPVVARADGTDGMSREEQAEVLQRNRSLSQKILAQMEQDPVFHRQFTA